MSKPIVIVQNGLRILVDHNDESRKPSEVVSYKLSPEEIEKRYGSTKKIKTKGEDDDMRQSKMSKEQLVNEIRNGGLNKGNYKRIGEKFGLDIKSIYARVSQYKIKDLLENEEKVSVNQVVEEVREPVEIHSKLNYYISTGFENKAKAKQFAEIVTAAGGQITYEWWNDEYTEDAIELAKAGEADLQGIRDADVVVVMLPGAQGTHTEFGAALALGKKILLYGTGGFGAIPFYHMAGVHQVVGSEMDLVIEALKGSKVGGRFD